MKFIVKCIAPETGGLYYGPLGLGLTSRKLAQVFDSEDIKCKFDKGIILSTWWDKDDVRLVPVGGL